MRRAPSLTALAASGLVLALPLTACSEPDPPADSEPSPTPTSVVATAGTPPGTDLDLGESAVLAWQPTRDLAGELELTVVADPPVEDRLPLLGHRDDAMAAARPYFVTVTVANVGESDLGGQDVPLYLRDTDHSLGAPWTLGGDFAACQSGPLPDPFEAGAEAEMCLVYLVPDGGRVRDLVFEPTEGYDPITWTGEVDLPAKRKQDQEKHRKQRRG